jgi:hypothetical protein
LNVLITDTGQGFVPRWRRDPNVVRTHVPGAGADRVQVLGRGNPRVRLQLAFTSDAEYAALEAMVADGVTGTLDDPFGDGDTFSSVGLTDLTDPRRQGHAAWWEATAEFEIVQ